MKTPKITASLALALAASIGAAGVATASPDPSSTPPVSGTNESAYGSVERLAGRDRIATALEAAKAIVKSHSVSTVIVARSDLHPDALAAVPLADTLNAPVLLNKPTGALDARNATFIKSRKIKKVIILGSENALSVQSASDLEKLVGFDNVDRIGGINRYETAYDVAADSVAAYSPSSATAVALADAKAALRDSILRERKYQSALSAYNAAGKAFSATRTDLKNAQASYAEQLAAVADLAKQLKNVPNVPDGYASWDAYIAEAQSAYQAALNKYTTARASLDFLSVTLSNNSIGTNLGIKSTLGDYRAKFPKLAADITKAESTFGLSDSTTLEDAIKTGTVTTNAAADALPPLAGTLSDRVAEKIDAAKATSSNAAVLEKLGAANAELARRAKVLANAINAYEKALAALTKAQQDLAAATVNRPYPGEIDDDADDVASARDAVVRAGGNRSAFVATGTSPLFALAGGPAAANKNGVVLLSQGSSLGTWATKFLKLSNAQSVGLGSEATSALKNSWSKGNNRYFASSDATKLAAQVSQAYFKGNAPIAIAGSDDWPDSLTAGSFASQYEGTVLLSTNDKLSAAADDYVKYTATEMDYVPIRLIGGRLSDKVFNQLLVAIHY